MVEAILSNGEPGGNVPNNEKEDGIEKKMGMMPIMSLWVAEDRRSALERARKEEKRRERRMRMEIV